MPSFVNLGAYVDSGTMVDTWATVGSCAQIGKNCHISGGAGIGGVLEPLQAGPVVIEDDCFIGARAEVAEGVVVRRRLGAVDGRLSRRLHQDRRPRKRQDPCGRGAALFRRRARHAAGQAAADGKPGPNLYCAVIVKRVDEQTRSKTSINELLRDCDEEGPAVNGTPKLLEWAAKRGETLRSLHPRRADQSRALGDMIKIGRRGSLSAP
jgi:2,3,4,5-tetrahydropyridine-2,6-dicarboxylate N-succinyltransferase